MFMRTKAPLATSEKNGAWHHLFKNKTKATYVEISVKKCRTFPFGNATKRSVSVVRELWPNQLSFVVLVLLATWCQRFREDLCQVFFCFYLDRSSSLSEEFDEKTSLTDSFSLFLDACWLSLDDPSSSFVIRNFSFPLPKASIQKERNFEKIICSTMFDQTFLSVSILDKFLKQFVPSCFFLFGCVDFLSVTSLFRRTTNSRLIVVFSIENIGIVIVWVFFYVAVALAFLSLTIESFSNFFPKNEKRLK